MSTMDRDAIKAEKCSQKRLERAREYSENGLLVNVMMNDIVDYNCDGLCAEAFCGNKYTKHTNIKINGLRIHIGLCDEHADMFESCEDDGGNC